FDSGSREAVRDCPEQVGPLEANSRRKRRDGENHRRYSRTPFLSRLRARPRRLGAHGRERRSTFPPDRYRAQSGRGPHRHGSVEPIAPRGLRRKSAPDDRDKAAEIVLRGANQDRKRRGARRSEDRPLCESAEAPERHVFAISRTTHPRGLAVSRAAGSFQLPGAERNGGTCFGTSERNQKI